MTIEHFGEKGWLGYVVPEIGRVRFLIKDPEKGTGEIIKGTRELRVEEGAYQMEVGFAVCGRGGAPPGLSVFVTKADAVELARRILEWAQNP